MADAGRQYQRFVIDGANLDIQAEGGLLRLGGKKSFGAQMLNLSQGGLQFLAKNEVPVKEKDKLAITVILRDQRNLKLSGELVWRRETPDRPFIIAGLKFGDLDPAVTRTLRDMEHDFVKSQEQEMQGQTGRLIRAFALPPEDSGRDVAAAQAAEAKRFGQAGKRQIQRPVALLSLISKLESFPVTDELVLGVLEAAEQNLAVEDLFKTNGEVSEEARPRRVAPEPKKEAENKPIPVYRLAPESRLHFNEEGMPVAPPVDALFYSKIDAAECFACELQTDRMSRADGGLSFVPGDVIIFSKSAKVENGCYAFVATKSGNEFTQVFFGQDDQIRLRPQNGNNPEVSLKRGEVKICYRMIARLQKF